MKAYKMIGEVDEFHELRLIVPPEIPVGVVKIIVEIEEAQSPEEDSLLSLVVTMFGVSLTSHPYCMAKITVTCGIRSWQTMQR